MERSESQEGESYGIIDPSPLLGLEPRVPCQFRTRTKAINTVA